jgi:hypothetical protein
MSAQEEIQRLDELIASDWPDRDNVACRSTLRWAIGRIHYLAKPKAERR